MDESKDYSKTIFSKIINMPLSKDSWTFIAKNPKHFLCTDEEIDWCWNGYAKRKKYGKVQFDLLDDRRWSLTYKHNTSIFEVDNCRDDKITFILNLAKVLRNDFKILYCKDSGHSSDLVFLPVSCDEWECNKYLQDREAFIKRFFLLENTDTNRFIDEVFKPENRNVYESEGLSGNNFFMLFRGLEIPSPADWVSMFEEYGAKVGWRKALSGIERVEDIHGFSYSDYYLQDFEKISKTKSGLSFSVEIFNDSYKIYFYKNDFGKKKWSILLKILVRFNKILIQSEDGLFTPEEWKKMYS